MSGLAHSGTVHGLTQLQPGAARPGGASSCGQHKSRQYGNQIMNQHQDSGLFDSVFFFFFFLGGGGGWVYFSVFGNKYSSYVLT